jgi:sugar lactone lactonase YvrE
MFAEGNGGVAVQLLDECQWNLRGWEHRHLWTRFNSKQTFLGHTSYVYSVAWSPDGQRLVTGSQDQTAKVWDADKGQEVLSLKGHTLLVTSVAWSPDGKRVFAWAEMGKVLAWSVEDGKLVDPVNPPAMEPPGPARSPNGFLLAEPRGNVVAVFDPDKLATANHWPLPDRAERIRYHDEQARLARQQKQWFAAAFHLAKVADCVPWDAAARLAEARVWAQAEQPERSALAYVQAVLAGR